jgi:AraC family transcriptional regulator of adaptative response/methylated-DNA-[protein]-cysteine methyltransferase
MVKTTDTLEMSDTEHDPRWALVASRDRRADGNFVYAVQTTGVFCRPSCPSRLAKPRNVTLFTTCAEARRAGYRACQRCKPEQPGLQAEHAAIVAETCRVIEAAEEAPSLERLAAKAGMSSSHFHRLFKAATGLTPKAYAQAQRAKRVREELANQDASVTSAIYGAGFNSNGRFYESVGDMLGMTPSDYRSGGANADIHFAVGECSLGSILVARSERGVCAILLGAEPDELARDLQDRFPQARLIGGDAGFETLVAQIIGFVEAPALGLDLPLDVRGTAFQQRVWQALRQVPAGSTVSYAEVARRIGAPGSARAVAQACGANALAVAIPCHRVVRNDGALSGYRWGVERKQALLRKEGVS